MQNNSSPAASAPPAELVADCLHLSQHRFFSRPTIVAASKTPAWKSAIQRNFGHTKINWALDIDDGLEEVALTGAGVVILELQLNSIASECLKVSSIADRGGTKALFFAVGDASLVKWLPLIQISGFVSHCVSLEQLTSFAAVINRTLQKQIVAQQSIEEQVLANLPWKPIR